MQFREAPPYFRLFPLVVPPGPFGAVGEMGADVAGAELGAAPAARHRNAAGTAAGVNLASVVQGAGCFLREAIHDLVPLLQDSRSWAKA